MNLPSVIITRPLRQAAPLAARIGAIGRNPVLFPLLEIEPLEDPAPLRAALDQLRNYAMVVFVSPNAIEAVFSMLRQWPAAIPIAIMGEGSRLALAQYGVTSATATLFSPSDPLRTDSETLLQALDLPALAAKQVLIVRGESGREWLADGLRAAGIYVTQIAAYRRIVPPFDSNRLSQLDTLLTASHDWIVTSSEALRNLMHMVQQTADAADVAKMQQQHLIVPHARIAETAQSFGFLHITLTGSGDEQLLAALQSSL